jgi:hypothetical protein
VCDATYDGDRLVASAALTGEGLVVSGAAAASAAATSADLEAVLNH